MRVEWLLYTCIKIVLGMQGGMLGEETEKHVVMNTNWCRQPVHDWCWLCTS